MHGVSALNLTKYSISLLCDANAICTNTNGSFSCMCSHGYIQWGWNAMYRYEITCSLQDCLRHKLLMNGTGRNVNKKTEGNSLICMMHGRLKKLE